MARIAGVNLPLNKRSEIGLTYIYGDRPLDLQASCSRASGSTPTPTSAT